MKSSTGSLDLRVEYRYYVGAYKEKVFLYLFNDDGDKSLYFEYL